MDNLNLCLEVNTEAELHHTIFFPHPYYDLGRPKDKVMYRWTPARASSDKPLLCVQLV